VPIPHERIFLSKPYSSICCFLRAFHGTVAWPVGVDPFEQRRHPHEKWGHHNLLYVVGDEQLTQQVRALSEILFAQSKRLEWNGKIMASQLQRYRKSTAPASKARTALPPLNPDVTSL